MEKNNKCYVFEVEDEGKYLLGSTSFNDDNNFPYEKLKLWRFYNDTDGFSTELNLLQFEDKIVASYGDSEEITSILVSKGVMLQKHKIDGQSQNGETLYLAKGFELELYFYTSYSYTLLDSNRNKVFCSYYHGPYNGSPIIHPISLINKKVELLYEGVVQSDGKLPHEMNPYLLDIKKEFKNQRVKDNGSTVKAILVTLGFFILLFGVLTQCS